MSQILVPVPRSRAAGVSGSLAGVLGRIAPAPVWAAVIILALFYVIAVPFMARDISRGPGYGDEQSFHLIVVKQFIAQWPAPDVSDYPATATPLYHLVVAGLGKTVDSSLLFMRLVGSVFSAGLLAGLGYWLTGRLGLRLGVLMTLPFMLSAFILPRSICLGPDNAGWMFVAFMMMLSLRSRIDWKFYAAAGVGSLLLALVRQSHIWACAPIWLAAWMGPAMLGSVGRSVEKGEGVFGGLDGLKALLMPTRDRLIRTGIAIAVCVPAFVAVAAFAKLWGGMVPPLMQTRPDAPHSAFAAHTVVVLGGNVTIPAVMYCMLGAYGPLMLGYHWTSVKRVLAREPHALIVVAASTIVAFLACALPHTDFSAPMQRFDDLWRVGAMFPTIAHRSLLIIGLGTVGGSVLGVLLLSLERRANWILLGTLVAFAAAHMANFSAWQRYVEPFILLVLAMFTALVLQHRTQGRLDRVWTSVPRFAHVGLVVLMGALLTITVLKHVTPEERATLMALVSR